MFEIQDKNDEINRHVSLIKLDFLYVAKGIGIFFIFLLRFE